MDKKRVLQVLKGGVTCKGHRSSTGFGIFVNFKHSFVAKEAVEFLIKSRTVSSETEAIRVGRAFEKEGIIQSLFGKGVFDNDGTLYRFRTKLNKREADDIMIKIEPLIEVKNRKYRLSTYKSCFVGSEFVDTVVGALAVDRNKASQIGHALMQMERPYIQHVTDSDKEFEDGKVFYRFDKVPPKKSESTLKQTKFESIFTRGEKLGEGAFSVVIEATEKKTKTSYAIKVVTKSRLSIEDENALKDEIQVLRELKHPHIICLYGVFDELDHIYLVTERMRGGELFDRIVQKAYYNEKEARDVCKILLNALFFCHSKCVAHRDLKPENLLLMSMKEDDQLKVADFGFAKKCFEPKCLTTQCGTPGYVAPEILVGTSYDTQCDIWSLGVIIYTLLGGYPPFIEKNQKNLFRRIQKGEYEFHPQYWSTVSPGAKKLITRMLTVDPDKRITAEEALNDNWILGEDDLLAGMDLSVNLSEFKKFNARRKFKGAVNAIMLANKMESLGLDMM